MPSSDRRYKVRVANSALKEIDLLRGNKTQKEFINVLIKTYKQHDVLRKKLHEKDVEIAKLRSEKAAEVSKGQKAYTSLRKPKLPLPQPPQTPIPCLRNIRIFASDQRLCHEVCKLKHPVEYRACQETKAERSMKP